MVFCLEHMAQLMTLPLTVSCFLLQIDFTFLVPAYLGSPGQRAVKRVCVCVCDVIAYLVSELIGCCCKLLMSVIVTIMSELVCCGCAGDSWRPVCCI